MGRDVTDIDDRQQVLAAVDSGNANAQAAVLMIDLASCRGPTQSPLIGGTEADCANFCASDPAPLVGADGIGACFVVASRPTTRLRQGKRGPYPPSVGRGKVLATSILFSTGGKT